MQDHQIKAHLGLLLVYLPIIRGVGLCPKNRFQRALTVHLLFCKSH